MAIFAAAAIGIGSSLYGGSQAKKAAKKAKKERIAMLQRIGVEYDQAYKDQTQMLSPWHEAGKTALRDLEEGIKTGAFEPDQFKFDYESFEKDPGYQFRLKEGMRAMEQSAAARGNLLSGAQQRAIQGYSQDMASQEYGNAYNRALTEYGLKVDRGNRQYGRLANMAGAGQNAANSLANYRGQKASAMAGVYGDMGNTLSGYELAKGNANINMANSVGNILQGAMGYGGNQGGGGNSMVTGMKSNAVIDNDTGLVLDYPSMR